MDQFQFFQNPPSPPDPQAPALVSPAAVAGAHAFHSAIPG